MAFTSVALVLLLLSVTVVNAVPVITGPVVTVASTVTEAGANRYVLNRLSEFKIADKGDLDEELAEFHAFDTVRNNIWLISSKEGLLRIFSVSNAGVLAQPCEFDVSAYGSPNSVTYDEEADVIAIAFAATPKVNNGKLVFVDPVTFEILRVYDAGANPDHVSFGTNSTCVYTANEGEHDKVGFNLIDAIGGITYVCFEDPAYFKDTSRSAAVSGTFLFTDLGQLSSATETSIREDGGHQAIQASTAANLAGEYIIDDTIDVESFGVKDLNGTTPSLLADLEPEYITYGSEGEFGVYEIYVVCQENNLFAVFRGNTDGNTPPQFDRFQLLGYKPFDIPGHEADFCDAGSESTAILREHPGVSGMYQPDTVKMIRQGGTDYIVTANEGDAMTRGDDILDIGSILNEEAEGYLRDDLNTGCLDEDSELKGTDVTLTPPNVSRQFVFGARSFSVWNARTGALVHDSGAQIAQMMNKYFAPYFNANDGKQSKRDGRSDNKGNEPESLASGMVDDKYLLFVGLERPGVIGIWDITDISAPEFHSLNGYQNFDDQEMTMVDPEALTFLGASKSPTGTPILIASGSISNTLTIFEVVLETGASMSRLGPQNVSNPDNELVSENEGSIESCVSVTPSPTAATSAPTVAEVPVAGFAFVMLGFFGVLASICYFQYKLGPAEERIIESMEKSAMEKAAIEEEEMLETGEESMNKTTNPTFET